MYELIIANKNYSSWSMRPWVLMRAWDRHSPSGCCRFTSNACRAIARLSRHRSRALPGGRRRCVGLACHSRIPGGATSGVWPSDASARLGTLRIAEMHSRIPGPAQRMLHECRRADPPAGGRRCAAVGPGRIEELWADGLARHGGPYLGGATVHRRRCLLRAGGLAHRDLRAARGRPVPPMSSPVCCIWPSPSGSRTVCARPFATRRMRRIAWPLRTAAGPAGKALMSFRRSGYPTPATPGRTGRAGGLLRHSTSTGGGAARCPAAPRSTPARAAPPPVVPPQMRLQPGAGRICRAGGRTSRPRPGRRCSAAAPATGLAPTGLRSASGRAHWVGQQQGRPRVPGSRTGSAPDNPRASRSRQPAGRDRARHGLLRADAARCATTRRACTRHRCMPCPMTC